MARAIRKAQNDQMDMFGDLFRFTMFRTLSAESLTNVAEIMRKETFSVGSDLTFTSDEIIFVAEGGGIIVQRDHMISRVKAGQTYNLSAMFSADGSDTIDSLSFRPATTGRVYAVDSQNFRYNALNSPQLGAALLKELCEQLAAQTNELVELRHRDSNTERVVGRIEALTEAFLGGGTRSKTGIIQLKYKLDGDISELIAGAKRLEIRQFYVDSNTADEDRVRILNNNEYYRTTRFISIDGQRTEFERAISLHEVTDLEKLKTGADIYKSRYEIDIQKLGNIGVKKLSVDVFDAPVRHKGLILLEADFEEKSHGSDGVKSLIEGVAFEDVSKDDEFSNRRLAH